LIAEPLDKLSARPERSSSSRVDGRHSRLPPRERSLPTTPSDQQQLGTIIERSAPNDTAPELADDLLRGADEIAAFIFGTPESRRKVYYLAECCRLPVFRLGSMLCARRSVLMNWIAGQESRVSSRNG
jgi:hypothetical protein